MRLEAISPMLNGWQGETETTTDHADLTRRGLARGEPS